MAFCICQLYCHLVIHWSSSLSRGMRCCNMPTNIHSHQLQSRLPTCYFVKRCDLVLIAFTGCVRWAWTWPLPLHTEVIHNLQRARTSSKYESVINVIFDTISDPLFECGQASGFVWDLVESIVFICGLKGVGADKNTHKTYCWRAATWWQTHQECFPDRQM